MATEFDAKQELAAFYERHFDDLVERCLEASSRSWRFSPLNTLPLEERRAWVSRGFTEIMQSMLGRKALQGENVYYPRVSELGDSPLFGIADVADCCESALLPDEAILPLLWRDYGSDPDILLALVLEFRSAQNAMTKARIRQQMKDFEHYLSFVRETAIVEERSALENGIYQRFYLALRSLRGKTADVYDLVGEGASTEMLQTEITQLKMMEADLLAEVLRVNPDFDPEHRESVAAEAPTVFTRACSAHGLTEREREVVSLVAQGLSNGEISDRLALAESTVKNRLSDILSKLGKSNRAQIVVFAGQNGYFDK